jgi:spore coat protein CotH
MEFEVKEVDIMGFRISNKMAYMIAMVSFVLLVLLSGCGGSGNKSNPTIPPLNLGKIAGQVIVNGEPREGVEVLISGSNRMASTNDAGYFVLNDLPFGTYKLEVRHPGYEVFSKDVVVKPGKVVYLGKIELKPLSTIKGQVTFYGQENFSGTVVELVELKMVEVTDRAGNFSFQVPEGEYTLRITREGFREKEVKVKAVSGSVVQLPIIRIVSEKGSGVRPEPDDSIFVGENPFAVPKVHVVKFYFSDDAVAKLRAQNNMNAPRIDVPGKMIIDDEVFDNVAVHLRGGIGSFRTFDDKPGLMVDLNKFAPGQRYRGLAKLSFHNSVQDPSYICEYIGYYMWRLAGIPAPEITWAKVYINDRYKGLYYIKEAVDKDFLKRWFYNPNGNLYKAVIGPSSDFNSGPSAWELHTNVNTGDKSDLVEVANVVNRASTPQQLMDIIWDYVDQDNYITNWAMEDLTNHWDGYVQQSWNNNLYIYHDPMTNKFFIIPHGADQLFQGSGRPALRTPVASRLYQDPRFREMLKARRLEILRTIWDAEKLCAKIDEVRNALRKDAPAEINAGEGRARDIKNFIRSRPSYAMNWP